MLKVAVIEDHPVYRAGLRAVLGRESDIEVIGEAGAAREGCAIVEERHPDVVLLDATLPGADGPAVARQLLRRFSQVRVLMFSWRLDESTAAEALGAGALGFLGKGQPVEDLILAVRTVGAGARYLPPEISEKAVQARLRRGREGPVGVLSQREREVFDLLVRGVTNEGVAEHLRISRRTVETHRSRILKKLHVHSAVELTRLAARHGLLGA